LISNFAERQNSISLDTILPEPVHPNLQIRGSMGSFSLSFKGLLLHLETLFDETGGESCLKFLDSLEGVSPEKRRAFLSACTKVLVALKESKQRAPFDDNEEKLIETLCSQILAEIKKPELSVISGGSRSKTAKRGKLMPILN
jgi:hypothetical protein